VFVTTGSEDISIQLNMLVFVLILEVFLEWNCLNILYPLWAHSIKSSDSYPTGNGKDFIMSAPW
jgi:hypothetical protein